MEEAVSSQMCYCTILHSMYSQAQSVVCTSRGCTHQIQCDEGVRQGCPLSPTLFALYTNDLMSELSGFGMKLVNHNVKGLMYADDVALVAESGADLEVMLDSLSCYCDKWNLSVNTRKSKVVVFSGGRFDSGCSAVYVQRFKIGACG